MGSSVLQVRLTGDPYIVHCVETALIVEALHASSKALEDIDERYSTSRAPLISLMSVCTFENMKHPAEVMQCQHVASGSEQFGSQCMALAWRRLTL